MIIETNRMGNTMTMKIEGWLDVMAAPLLQLDIEGIPLEITKLILECSRLEYISSSGLRTILAAHKKMSEREGCMVLIGVSNDVRNILDSFGLLKSLNVQ